MVPFRFRKMIKNDAYREISERILSSMGPQTGRRERKSNPETQLCSSHLLNMLPGGGIIAR